MQESNNDMDKALILITQPIATPDLQANYQVQLLT